MKTARRVRIPLSLGVLAGLAVTAAIAQPELTCNGFDDVLYIGDQVQDFVVPNLEGATVFFTVQGADGGNAEVVGLLGIIEESNLGGEGAQAGIGCRIGNGPGELAPGGIVRFIIGQAGANNTEDGFLPEASGGGGGGSAVLYLAPGGNWNANGVILAAAGAGGGAWTASALDNDGPGGDGLAGECGGNYFPNPADGGQGGCNGLGGGGQVGGGGAFGDGQGSGADFAGEAGFPAGGAGGSAFVVGQGGWGFGGGGALAGGGGGYSGGGSATGSTDGPSADGGGEGGGSFINMTYSVPGTGGGTLAGFSPRSDNGFAQYIITRFIGNDQPQSPDPVFDGVPVSGVFCGAAQSGAFACGPAIDGPDLWYTYTSPIDCAPSDITITVTSGDAEIQSYNTLLGNPISANDCRGASVNGVYTDTLNPGQTIRFRVQSPTGQDFTLEASSLFAAGLADCDGNGIPDTCDIAADPSLDCNGNGRPDSCDIADGTSTDCDSDGIPDECDPSDDCPPPNDDFADALPVGPGTYFYDTQFGTLDGPASCVSSSANADIWYEFTAPSEGQLVVEQNPFSAAVSLVSAALFDQQGLELECNANDSTGIAGSRVVRTLAANETVMIRIDGAADNFFGLNQGEMTVRFAPGLTNDRCENAIDAVLDTPYAIDPTLLEYGDPVVTSCTRDFDRLDIWYRYTSQAGGRTRFRSSQPLSGVTVFDGCGGNELGCERGFGTGSPPPTVEIDMLPGESVLIRVVDIAFLNMSTFIIQEVGPCNAADLADPPGVLDLADINAFTSGFITQDPVADLDGNGIFDLTDINIFTSTFVAGCP